MNLQPVSGPSAVRALQALDISQVVEGREELRRAKERADEILSSIAKAEDMTAPTICATLKIALDRRATFQT